MSLNEDEDDDFYDSEPSFVEPSDLGIDEQAFKKALNLSGELYEEALSTHSRMPSTQTPPKIVVPHKSSDSKAVAQTPSAKTIYAIQLLNSSEKSANHSASSSTRRIFLNRENAMKALKEDPDNRRFKQFKTFDEAYFFSYESQEIESGHVPTLAQVQAQLSGPSGETSSPARPPPSSSEPAESKSTPKVSNLAQDAEKLPFSAPKKPEINALRAMIERNDLDGFKDKVLSNPRFLISGGDTPVAVQESFRYNALHVCAKDNRHQICCFLLGVLSSTSYMQKLYPSDTPEQSKARTVHLLDSYLNTAEKGLGETPLHFACKFGSMEVARLLFANEHCDKMALNKQGKTPREIICTKAATEAAKHNAQEIQNMFEDCFYVPLYRDDDLGDVTVEKPSLNLDSGLKKSFSKNSSLHNASVNSSPFAVPSNHRKLAAFVGPVSPKIANTIYEKLKSPARLGRQSPSNIDILRSDDYKGYERIVRKLTEDMNLPWHEYWEFLKSYCNFKSSEGQVKLESYFKQKNLQRLLDMQIKAALNIQSDCLNNKSKLAGSHQADFAKSELHRKLGDLIDQIEELKLALDLNDSNTLSSKYEQFIHLFQANPNICKSQLPIKLGHPAPGWANSFDLGVMNRLNEELINHTLGRYMSLVIDVSKLDNSGRCYFKFYKASKSIIDSFSCKDLFTTFYLSPVYKSFSQSRIKSKVSEAAKSQGANLMSRLREAEAEVAMTSPFELRQPVEAAEDDGDSKKEPEEEEDEEEKAEEQMFDAQYTLADEEEAKPDKKLDIMAQLELITQKMEANRLDSTIGDEAGRGAEDEEDEEYSLNPVTDKVYRPRDASEVKYSECLAKQMFQQKHNAQDQARNLFIFGDGPSKLDRAVFLAMQDVNVDAARFPLLNDWFQFMNSCKSNEMQRWQTPSKGGKKHQMMSPFPRKIS